VVHDVKYMYVIKTYKFFFKLFDICNEIQWENYIHVKNTYVLEIVTAYFCHESAAQTDEEWILQFVYVKFKWESHHSVQIFSFLMSWV
jgi:hypothetical protein